MLSLFSSRRYWDSSNPSPPRECALPLWFRGVGHTYWRDRGAGDWESPNSDEWTYTVVFIFTLGSQRKRGSTKARSVRWEFSGRATGLTPSEQVRTAQDLSKGETHSLAGQGMGGPNSEGWIETLVVYSI